MKCCSTHTRPLLTTLAQRAQAYICSGGALSLSLSISIVYEMTRLNRIVTHATHKRDMVKIKMSGKGTRERSYRDLYICTVYTIYIYAQFSEEHKGHNQLVWAQAHTHIHTQIWSFRLISTFLSMLSGTIKHFYPTEKTAKKMVEQQQQQQTATITTSIVYTILILDFLYWARYVWILRGNE